jgi:hypothetical protein
MQASFRGSALNTFEDKLCIVLWLRPTQGALSVRGAHPRPDAHARERIL